MYIQAQNDEVRVACVNGPDHLKVFMDKALHVCKGKYLRAGSQPSTGDPMRAPKKAYKDLDEGPTHGLELEGIYEPD